MRILQLITKSEPGGGQSVAAVLANEFVARGHEVLVASGPEGGGEAWRGLDRRVEVEEISGLVRNVSPGKDAAALFAIRALYKTWKPDIVHVHTSKAAALGRLAGGVSPERIVYTMHGYDQLAKANKKFLFVDKLLKTRCGAIVAVSKRDEEAMRADGYEPLLIRNGADDLMKGAPPATPTSAALSAVKAKGLPVALMIARRVAPKRPDLVRAAAKSLVGTISVAWIGGERETGDPENFYALGSAPNAGSYATLADFLVLPSEHEGAPMSILEAFSAGKPVVASDVGGIPELLEARQPGGFCCGITVKNTVEGFAWAMRTLASDARKRITMGQLARDEWTKKYSGNGMANEYENLYNRFIVH